MVCIVNKNGKMTEDEYKIEIYTYIMWVKKYIVITGEKRANPPGSILK
jgi:hypothetical protein